MADYSKVQAELAAGRIWRAKEILQGRLGSSGYDTVLFEHYGNVLLQMGDISEAGKYLFLSGVRKPAYLEPIRIYLDRHKKSLQTMYGTFPAGVRSADTASYPDSVLKDLRAVGFSLSALKHTSRKERLSKSPRWELEIGIAIAVVLGLLFVGFVIQGFRGLGWLVETLAVWWRTY